MNGMHIDAARVDERRVLWLIDPDGTELGITPSDDDYNRQNALMDWAKAWTAYQQTKGKRP